MNLNNNLFAKIAIFIFIGLILFLFVYVKRQEIEEIFEDIIYINHQKIWHTPINSQSIAYSPDGEMVAILANKKRNSRSPNSKPSTIEIRRASDGEIVRIFDFYSTFSLTFSPDSKFIAASNNEGRINVWRIQDGLLINSSKNFDNFSPKISYLRFSADGQNLVSMERAGNPIDKRPRSIDIWNLSSSEKVYTISANYACIDTSPDGKLLATVNSGMLNIYRLSDGVWLRDIDLNAHWYSCRELEFSPDKKQIALTGLETKYFRFSHEKILIYDVNEGILKNILSTRVLPTIKTFNSINHKKELINNFTFSPDGKYVAASYSANRVGGSFLQLRKSLSSYGRIRIWELDRHEDLSLKPWTWTLKGHKVRTYALEFSPDGKMLASSGADSTIKFWKMPPRN